MRVRGPDEAEIRAIAEEVGLQIWNNSVRRRGRWYVFRLALGTTRTEDGRLQFQKIGRNGRALPYVCWHGHRAFYFALFRAFPSAVVDTSISYYAGREMFLRFYRNTFREGNGYNVSSAHECACPVQTSEPEHRRNWRPSYDRPESSRTRPYVAPVPPAWAPGYDITSSVANVGVTLEAANTELRSVIQAVSTLSFTLNTTETEPSDHETESFQFRTPERG